MIHQFNYWVFTQKIPNHYAKNPFFIFFYCTIELKKTLGNYIRFTWVNLKDMMITKIKQDQKTNNKQYYSNIKILKSSYPM